ncbi:MAG TPA: CmpA/NrtA family ABC transporter substrate-binding protein [Roseiflexaceae bacterium]|nr:CmpA/NrtA family ABC transporter substrate-binding protein [Roseiflexaceae bacterium]
MKRRTFLTVACAAPLLLSACAGASTSAPGAGVAAGAADLIRVGFIPLTDCASVVMADKLGLYRQYGLNVELTKEASWANIRDKLISGELHAAHCLFGMPFSVYTGIGGTAGTELKIAMLLNANGQGITLSKELAGVAYGGLADLKRAVGELAAKRTPSFAMTFPGGTHDLWLRYLLGAAGVDQNSVQIKTIPPPQMVANMKVGNMDGYSVGEPWNGLAVKEDIGYTFLATQDLWADHPEKALVANPAFAAGRSSELKKLMRAVLEASAWLDKPENRPEAAKVIGDKAFVNAPADVIDARLMGRYTLGANLGEKVFAEDNMHFHKEGLINAPRTGHAIWFLAQYLRFGYLKAAPDYRAVADRLILHDLYAEVARDLKLALPDDDMQPFTIKLDQQTFDPASPGV